MLFLLLIAVAPLVGAVGTVLFSPRGKEATRVWVYVLAVAIAMWAVAGEVLVALIFLDELRVAAALSSPVALIAQVLLLLLGAAALVYAVLKTVRTVLDVLVTRRRTEIVAKLAGWVQVAHAALPASPPAPPLQAVLNALKQQVATLPDWVLGGMCSEPPAAVSSQDTLDLLLKELQACVAGANGTKAAALLVAMQAGLAEVLQVLGGTSQASLASAVARLHAGVQVAAGIAPTAKAAGRSAYAGAGPAQVVAALQEALDAAERPARGRVYLP